ncbi:MAG: sec-independent protein translocase protein TatC, partial [Cryomorphaceae bacterium]
MSGQFTSHILVSMVLGFIVAFPYVFFQVWAFIMP